MSPRSISPSVESSLLEEYERGTQDDCAYNTLPEAPAMPPWGSGAWYYPYSSTMMYFSELSSYFSSKFLSWLAISNFFVSGGSYTLVSALSLPLFKGLGIDASRQQLYTCMINSPFAMKPCIGVVSDLMPILGYHKRYVSLFAILVGIIGCSALLWISPSTEFEEHEMEKGESAVRALTNSIVLCFTAVSYQAAIFDVIGSGKYAEIMNLYPASGSSIITFNYSWLRLGKVLVKSLVGPLADNDHINALLWICLVFVLMPLLPTLFGWLPEKKRSEEDPGMISMCGKWLLFDRGSFQEKKSMYIVITLCGLSTPVMALVANFASLTAVLGIATVLLVSFFTATMLLFPRGFFCCFLSIILIRLSSINIESGLGYYYTASDTCVPNGPNFDYTYYITVNGVVGSFISLLSVVLSQFLFSDWKFRPLIMVTIVIGALASVFDWIVIKRWNITEFGIPDKVFFLFGNTIVGTIVNSLQFIPLNAMYAKMAPEGMEAAIVAYVAGIVSFCDIVITMFGAGIIRWSGMVTVGENCNFDALPSLVLITKILIPIIIGIPATFLIPNVLQTEPLIDWGSSEDCFSNSSRTDEQERSELLASSEDDDSTDGGVGLSTSEDDSLDERHNMLESLVDNNNSHRWRMYSDNNGVHMVENMDEGLQHDLQTRNVRAQCPTLPPWIYFIVFITLTWFKR